MPVRVLLLQELVAWRERTRLYERLEREGRLRPESSGNDTDAELDFAPVLDR